MLHTLSFYALLATNTFLQWAIQFCLGSHAFVDCLLAGVMCYYLQKGRAGPGFSSVDSVVVKLMKYIVSSGVVTAACAIATLIAITLLPDSLLWTVFYYLLSKCLWYYITIDTLHWLPGSLTHAQFECTTTYS
ncbi:hypothetical protein PILCRDRAFT_825752 [Piloderma croceum F 1598]|uniref:DUF6534 domain-containing protein n=1 Tax=Piloderma croceum (strain F 1598) TaxID=765440 RepID=A0A0C3ASS8_PILCF|nr:hypothetical protein PILCRDRAFT_825752 [Piloderma croceum F 1598]